VACVIRGKSENGRTTARGMKQRYYRCSKSQTIVSPVTCDNGAINGPRIEKTVWEAVEDLLAKPESVLAALEEKQKEKGNDGGLEKEKELVVNRIKHSEKIKERIYKAYYLTGDEGVFKVNVEELTKEVNSLEKNKSDIEAKLESSQHYELEIEGIKNACQLVKDKLNNLTVEEKRLAMESLHIRVMVDGADIKIIGTIPLENQSDCVL